MIDDPEIQAIAKQQRMKRLKTVGIVVGVIVIAAVSILPSGGSVASALEADGYESVDVERAGLFEFTYKAKKGKSECSGRVTKMPGSTSQTSVCTSTTK